MRRLFFILLLTLLTVAHAVAGDYNLVDMFRVPPPEGAIAVDPIVSAAGTLVGFIYILPDSQSVVIDQPKKAPGLAAATGGYVIKTINCYVGDTLFVYSLLATTYPGTGAPWHPAVNLIKKHDGSLSSVDIAPTFNRPTSIYPQLNEVTSVDLFFSDVRNDSRRVILSAREMYFDYIITMGPIWQAVSTSFIFSLGLDSVLHRDGSSYLVRGDFTDGAAPDLCGFTDAYYSWDFRDSYDDPNYGTSASITVSAAKNDGELLAQQKTANGYGLRLFCGDFVDDPDDCDELIVTGYAKDLLGLHGTSAKGHMACYSFHNGTPQEVWYRALTPKLDFYFAWSGFITEIRDNFQVAHLNVATGQFDEVHTLPTLGYTRFFTTGPFNDVLNLLSLRDDTLRIYRYDSPTPVDEPTTGPTFPLLFSLSQNYPNPFNGTTVIRFELTHPDRIAIRIFNVLGQQVAKLVDGPFPSGTHRITWKPGADVASGVYLINLETADGSETIQTQYVK